MYDSLVSHVVVSPALNDGQATIRDTHITVAEILNRLASGDTIDDILGNYPPLTPLGVQAAIAYAARLVRQDDQQRQQSDS